MNENSLGRNGDSQPAGGYWNPYLAGLALGAVLLASFLVLGAGLGASAAPARSGASSPRPCAPEHTAQSEYFGGLVGEGEAAGVLPGLHVRRNVLGRPVLGHSGRRMRLTVERGRAFGVVPRLLLALAGGMLVGFASRLANGCTSGQALSGGAMLLNGSLVFMVCVFAGGYAAAWFVRRQWHD